MCDVNNNDMMMMMDAPVDMDCTCDGWTTGGGCLMVDDGKKARRLGISLLKKI